MTMAERKKIDGKKWGSKGVACPSCACRDSRVEATRNGHAIIRRIRVCRACGYKWQTREK